MKGGCPAGPPNGHKGKPRPFTGVPRIARVTLSKYLVERSILLNSEFFFLANVNEKITFILRYVKKEKNGII